MSRYPLILSLCVGLAAALLLGACGEDPGRGSGDGTIDSQTHWLSTCTSDDQCGDFYSCVCGVCTLSCDSASACNGTGTRSACFQSEEGARGLLCGNQEPAVGQEGVCLPQCGVDNACPENQRCLEGACVPDDSEQCVERIFVDEFVPADQLGSVLSFCQQANDSCANGQFPVENVTLLEDQVGYDVTCGCACDAQVPEPLVCNDPFDPEVPVFVVTPEPESQQERDAVLSWCARQSDRCSDNSPLFIVSGDDEMFGPMIACGCDCGPQDLLCLPGDFDPVQEFGAFPPEALAELEAECFAIGAEVCAPGFTPQVRAEAQLEEELMFTCDCVCSDGIDDICGPVPLPNDGLCGESQALSPIYDRFGCIVAWGCSEPLCEDPVEPDCPDGTEPTLRLDDLGCPFFDCVSANPNIFPCGEQEACEAPEEYCSTFVSEQSPEPESVCMPTPPECVEAYECGCLEELLREEFNQEAEILSCEGDDIGINIQFLFNDPPNPESFPCGDQGQCSIPGQYCLSLAVNGGQEQEFQCQDLPEACRTNYTCECLEELVRPELEQGQEIEGLECVASDNGGLTYLGFTP